MEITVDQALQQGVAAHKKGKLQDAERFYRAILRAQPSHPDANHNLGVLAVAVGKPLDAIPLFKLAVDTNPNIEQFWLSYIDALLKVGRFNDAEQALRDGEKFGVCSEKLGGFSQRLQGGLPKGANKPAKARSLSEKRKKLTEKKKNRKKVSQGVYPDALPSEDQIDHLLGHYQAGGLAEAESLAKSFTQNFPKHPFGWKILGAVYKQLGRPEESLVPMQSAVKLSPQDAEAHNNLGVTLKELGRLQEAEASYKRAIALKPDFAEAHNNLGNTLKEVGKLELAEASCRRALVLKPDYASAHSSLGNTLKELGKLDEAEESCRQAIALEPDNAEAYSNLGLALKELGKLGEAEASLRQAITIKPDYAEAHSNLGVTLREMGRLDDAEASCRQAVALKPTLALAHSNLGITLEELGKLGEAEGSFRQAIALKPDLVEAHRNLMTTKKFSSKDKQFCQMEALYRDSSISEHHRCLICFSLAKAFDDLGEFANAFKFYAEGNALRKKQLAYDRAQDTNLFQMLKATYPSVGAHSFALETLTPGHAPIFIIGMPRSGTTLVEQIISSHWQVTGAGELLYVSQFGRPLAVGQAPVDGKVLKTFRRQYLEALRQRSEGNAIVTDKMPHNFRFLGLIAAALPEAKIIHVKRDPAAVCWANYTQYFAKESLGYCYSLEDILHYHGLYEDLMKFWHQELPGRIYDLGYERLTEEQGGETRKLIDYLGLPWDDSCLSPEDNKRVVGTASNVQVRKKVYQGSSESWKRYQPYLNGALDHFSAGGK